MAVSRNPRILTLLGADLVVLPTNWATNARKMAELVSAARSWENHIYYLAVNRVGDEAGFHYIGMSSAADYLGNVLHSRLPRTWRSYSPSRSIRPPRREARRALPRGLRNRSRQLATARPVRPAGRGGAVSGPWNRS